MSDQSIPGDVCRDYESGAVMDAERMLNDIIFAATRLDSADSYQAELGAITRMEKIRSQLLPLIRSGLALQRLEKAMRETGMECANVGTNKDGAWCFLQCRDFSEPEGDGDTIPEAITAALDAAGVE